MALEKYTLHKDRKTGNWRLEKEGSNRAEKVFKTKKEAVQSLSKIFKHKSASVRIRKMDNTIQEERTYPRSKDPIRSPG